MKKILRFVIILCVVIFIVCGSICFVFVFNNKNKQYTKKNIDTIFSTRFIKESHALAKNQNYMISPYSVEISLSMLKDGLKGQSYKEIDNVLSKRKIKNLIVKDKVSVANAMFVKDVYKNDVYDEYSNNIKNKYNAELLYDEFKTPTVINNWVNDKTNGMISSILDTIDSDFVLGIANAVAMEEKWAEPFECDDTSKKEFNPINGKSYDVSMMENTFKSVVSYYKDDESEAILLPYKMYDTNTGEETNKDGEQLEFIGILPKDIDKYIDNLDINTIKNIDKKKRVSSDELTIHVELPKFDFLYDFSKFKKTLNNMGINKIFSEGADFSNMIENHPDLHISKAIHKTYVKVDEVGTKAAAVTYYGTVDSVAPSKKSEYIDIVFDRPFIYIIKDTKSDEIVFFGVVYNPNKYKEATC